MVNFSNLRLNEWRCVLGKLNWLEISLYACYIPVENHSWVNKVVTGLHGMTDYPHSHVWLKWCISCCGWGGVGGACVHAQSCLTLCNPMDCSLPSSSVHRILQARILEWVAISCSGGSSLPRDQTCVSCIGRQILYHWTTQEAPCCGWVVYNDVL